jgi:hypothetical protein
MNFADAKHRLSRALFDLEFHNAWGGILANNSLAAHDLEYHRAQAEAARVKVEAARAELAPEIEKGNSL